MNVELINGYAERDIIFMYNHKLFKCVYGAAEHMCDAMR